MPFDGSGNFTRVRSWVADAAAAIKIRSDFHDQEDDNLASGLSNTLTKDGQSQPTADIPMNGKKLVNVGAPTDPTDAATKDYADSVRDFNTAINLTGAVPEARIGFTAADIGFGARVAGTPAGFPSRFVWNNEPDLSGTDVAVMDDTGRMALKGAAMPHTSRSALTAGGDVTLRNGFGLIFNAYWDDAAATFKAATAGFSMSFGLDQATGTFNLIRSTASAPADAALAVETAMTVSQTEISFPNDGKFTFGRAALSNVAFQYKNATVLAYKISGSGGFYWRKSSDGTAGGTGVADLMWLSDTGTLAAYANVAAANNLTAVNGTMIFGSVGSDRVAQFSSGYYLEWLTSGGDFRWIGNSAERFRITVGGNLTISGPVGTKSSGTTWANPSDARIKTVVGDYETGLAEILQLQPRRFTYKGNDTAVAPGTSVLAEGETVPQQAVPYADSPHYQMAVDGTEVAGFVAQEVEAVMPAMVTQGPGYIDGKAVDDFRVLDTSDLILALVNAVKELSARIATLEAGA